MPFRLLNLLFFLCLFPATMILAQDVPSFWTGLGAQKPVLLRSEVVNIKTENAYYFKVDAAAFAKILATDQGAGIQLDLPDPKGQSMSFWLQATSIMEQGLAQKIPNVKTYKGQSLQQPALKIYLTYSPDFFQVTVQGQQHTWYLDAYTWPAREVYQSYYREACQETANPECRLVNRNRLAQVHPRENLGAIEGVLREYRLAVSASYSYYNYFGRDLERTLAGIVATVNRVNMVYERDLGIRLILVADNDQLIVTDPEDPIFTRDFQEDVDNQAFIDRTIGRENYDVGHVFSAGGGGGYADLGAVCNDDIKAHGFTGLNRPQGDAFDIDFVAHEIGHQFGANHTFNGVDGSCGGSWYPFTAFEPGAGTTIMAYAGICGSDNITPGSDPYFHGGSIAEINSFLLTSGSACANFDTTGNQAPQIDLPIDRLYLPVLTPFELSATVTDEDTASLLYSWEQVDRGAPLPLGNYGGGNEPLFRSYSPDTIAQRTFPQLSDILNNRPQSVELLPNGTRDLNFQLTVRDQDTLGPAVGWARVKYFVDGDIGPFRVDNLARLRAGTYHRLEWSVNGTDKFPVSADSVILYLSTDGGYNFSQALDTFPNTGLGVFFLPEGVVTDSARLKLKAKDHIFFDISDQNLPVSQLGEAASFVEVINASEGLIFCASDTLRLPYYYNAYVNGVPTAAEVRLNTDDFTYIIDSVSNENRGEILLLGATQLSSGTYPLELIVQTATAVDTLLLPLELQGQDAFLSVESDLPAADEIDVAIRPGFSWQSLTSADEYQVEVALDSTFETIVYQSGTLTDTSHQVTDFLADTTRYFWRVQAFNFTCGTTGFSTPRAFTTQQVVCREFRPSDLPVPFNALPFIQSNITVPTDVTVLDVNVKNIQGTYDNPSGLNFRLRSPAGPIIDLLNRREICNVGDSFDFSVDDEAGTAFVPCPNDAGITFEPVRLLSTYDGQRAIGRWSLSIFDDGGEGQLENWVLELCYGAPAGVVSSNRRSVAYTSTVKVYPNPLREFLNFESRTQEIAQLRVLDMLGRVVLTQKNVQAASLSIPVYDWPKGTYVYQLQLADGQVQVGKLVR